jgi:adenine-specific DNA-methyltransferase
MCDEIFGRAAFVANVVWQKKYTVANDARWLSDNHDHILVFCKDPSVWKPNRLPRSQEMNARYKNPDSHPKGPWKSTPLHAKSGSAKADRFEYTFRNGVKWSPPPGTYPRFSVETLERLDANDEIWFGRDGKSTPARKTFLASLSDDGVPALTIWTHDEVGHNHEAKEEVRAFNSVDVFATPKPERLMHRILALATDVGDLVLDSFAGSGTTGAVAQKLGRRWVMVEVGEHCNTHIVPRLRSVAQGTDPAGVTAVTQWKGGGGFRFYRLAPSLLERDKWGNWVVNRKYNPAMLAESVCKLEGFRYEPDPETFWIHGRSTERDFLYVTTQTLTRPQLARLSEEVGPSRTVLVCCGAFRGGVGDLGNLTVKKIPQAVLHRCEWGHDDYSLNVANLPMAADVPQSSGGTFAAAAMVRKHGKR